MPVLWIISARPRLRKMPQSRLLTLLLLFVTSLAALPGFARSPGPSTSIPLEDLGYQSMPNQFMLAGSSMLTLDYVDNKHLLLTYNVKRLLKRLPDCPASDQDRIVEALLLELPSGKVLARTEWRTHDRGMYLWNLGQGRFMLRVRDELSTFAPMINLSHGDAFRLQSFIRSDRRIGGILFSPEADLMLVETLDPPKPKATIYGDVHSSDQDQDDDGPGSTPVQIHFLRLVQKTGDEIEVHPGGIIHSKSAGRIPANSAGYIATLDQGQQHWAFNFQSYGGKVKELAAFDSTCRPSPILVSPSEFIAFGCHTSHTPQVVGAFNLRGEEMWEQNMTESYVAPTFAYAPGSGRFAFSRLLTRTALIDNTSVSPEMFDGQSIIVYQIDSGQQLLRIDASPIARVGQNYALSPDGLGLAVVRNQAVEIYDLPPLSPKDRAAVQMAQQSAPHIDGDPGARLSSGDGAATSIPAGMTLPNATGNASATAQQTGAAPAAPANASAERGQNQDQDQGQGQTPPSSAPPPPAPPPDSAPAPSAAQGDEQPTRRKPPSLYAPGEKHDGTPQQEEPR